MPFIFTQIKTLYSHLETSITTLPERELEQSLAKLDTVYSTTISEGQRLLERFKLSPGDQVAVIQKLTTLMEDLQRRKNGIDCLMTERIKVKGHTPASVARSNGVVSGEVPLTRVPSDSLVSKKYTNMYGELEEEAYKVCYTRCQGYKRVIKVIQSLPVLYDFYYTVGKGSS